MHDRSQILGFSELKDLLISTYKIQRSRELVRLHFSISDFELLMHDFDDHRKSVSLCFDIRDKNVRPIMGPNATTLVEEALEQKIPEKYLNDGFLKNGFYSFRIR